MDPIDRPLVEAVPMALLILGPDGRVVAASRPLRQLLDLDDDPAGRPARFLSRLPGWQRAWKLVEQGAKWPQVVALEDGSGDRRYYELTVTSDATGSALTLVDVTAMHHIHQQLRSASKLLAAARSQLLVSRDEMRRAEAQLAELVGELETLSSPDDPTGTTPPEHPVQGSTTGAPETPTHKIAG